jgi:hypothetical protein
MLSFNAELNSVYPKRSKKERYEQIKKVLLNKDISFIKKIKKDYP